MKFKNPLDYIDKFNDLIKFAFKNNHSFLGVTLLLFSFVIPILFYVGYCAVPLEKYIKNPNIVSGVIKEYKYGKGGYRNYAGCLISIDGNGKTFTHKYADFLLKDKGISNSNFISFCDKVKNDYINKNCVTIKMANDFLMEYRNCNQAMFYIKQDWDWHYKVRYISYLVGLMFLIMEICLLVSLNKKYKNKI